MSYDERHDRPYNSHLSLANPGTGISRKAASQDPVTIRHDLSETRQPTLSDSCHVAQSHSWEQDVLGHYEARDMDLDLSWNAPSWMPALLFDRPLNSLSSIAGRPLVRPARRLVGTVGSGPIGLIGDLIATQPPEPTQARARRSAATDTATKPRAAIQKRLVITPRPAQDAARNLMLNMVIRIAITCQCQSTSLLFDSSSLSPFQLRYHLDLERYTHQGIGFPPMQRQALLCPFVAKTGSAPANTTPPVLSPSKPQPACRLPASEYSVLGPKIEGGTCTKSRFKQVAKTNKEPVWCLIEASMPKAATITFPNSPSRPKPKRQLGQYPDWPTHRF
ncbi:uncharacterized protein CLUP02_08647 [Colletotrichum lupini]|uniref:Uncharacterized protein n=1 Tax=Colletotrichum lupini TaxID=145971 RepID=A0A9Q8WH24_9PEZI|nr:uncharacterized protein CLUP02_08647 [Colletotrichum lupini]UQC83154.1 hypothetical protein CLUP02_08647 [Colletotrichum lupini]